MAITRITIENFKGIADRVEVDLKPITVLFGAKWWPNILNLAHLLIWLRRYQLHEVIGRGN